MDLLASGQACKLVLKPDQQKAARVPESAPRTEDPGIKGTVGHC